MSDHSQLPEQSPTEAQPPLDVPAGSARTRRGKTYGAKPIPGTVFTKHARSEKRLVTGWHSGRVHWCRYPDGKAEHVSTAGEWSAWAETAWVISPNTETSQPRGQAHE